MATPANLDAFIPRDDFFAEAIQPNPFDELEEFGLVELATSLATLLRKPDFQRETAAWDPQRIKDFIKSFAEGDLIPAVIFWGSPKTGNIFVVDGAHRLSALLAWLKDDYGDTDISQKFFDYRPNVDQLKAAEATRGLIDKEVGKYADIMKADKDKKALPRHATLCPIVKRKRITVQWIRGDASKAEDSFYKINLQAVRLDKTELHLIKSRRQPSAIATRAIVRAGTGHPYWKSFSAQNQTDTVKYAKDINSTLFHPPLKQPIKSLDLPFGGQPYGGDGMRLVMEVVDFANKSAKPNKRQDGTATVEALQRTWKVVTRICGTDPSSLGLNPAVYVYSHSTGKHQPSAFMAVLRWIEDLDARNSLERFSAVRKDFEDFLIAQEYVFREIVSKKGSRSRAVPTIVGLYEFTLGKFLEGKSSDVVLADLTDDLTYGAYKSSASDVGIEYGAEISTEVKSQVFIREALSGAARCKICGARLYPGKFNYDHVKEKRNKGLGEPKNVAPAHFYCNSNKDKINAAIKAHRESVEMLA